MKQRSEEGHFKMEKWQEEKATNLVGKFDASIPCLITSYYPHIVNFGLIKNLLNHIPILTDHFTCTTDT